MPHKQKKSNALKNGSPKAEKKLLLPEPLAEGSGVAHATNYKEIHENETDALRSIYADDFEDVEVRRAAWQVSGMRWKELRFLYITYLYITSNLLMYPSSYALSPQVTRM
jgi:hypothetical protein